MDGVTGRQEEQAGRTGLEPRALGWGPGGATAWHEAARPRPFPVAASSSQETQQTSRSEASCPHSRYRLTYPYLCSDLPWTVTATREARAHSVCACCFQAGGHGGRGRTGEDRRQLPSPGAGQGVRRPGGAAAAERVGRAGGRRAGAAAAASAGSSLGGCGAGAPHVLGEPAEMEQRSVQNPGDEGAAPTRPANKALLRGGPDQRTGSPRALCSEPVSARASSSLELSGVAPDFTWPATQTCVSERLCRAAVGTRPFPGRSLLGPCPRRQGGHASAWCTVGAPRCHHARGGDRPCSSRVSEAEPPTGRAGLLAPGLSREPAPAARWTRTRWRARGAPSASGRLPGAPRESGRCRPRCACSYRGPRGPGGRGPAGGFAEGPPRASAQRDVTCLHSQRRVRCPTFSFGARFPAGTKLPFPGAPGCRRAACQSETLARHTRDGGAPLARRLRAGPQGGLCGGRWCGGAQGPCTSVRSSKPLCRPGVAAGWT